MHPRKEDTSLQPSLDYNYYSLFSLLVRSNVLLPGIPPISATASSPDLDLYLGVAPDSQVEPPTEEYELTDVSSYSTENGEPVYRMWRLAKGKLLRIDYFDGTQFWVDRDYRRLWAAWPPALTLEDSCTYLLGPVLGILLRLRGVTCLHASAVAFGDYCVAFVGSAGAGKSTTAAAFAHRGNRILSDDIVALEERDGDFYVLPAYPHLCLWPDSVDALYGSPEALPRFVPDWDKRRLALGEKALFESRTLPLRAVYFLGERRSDPAPYVEKVAPQDALIVLVTESYANKFLDRKLRAHEFELLGRLATRVPIRTIHANQNSGRLEDFCNVIREDCADLEPHIPEPH